MSAIDKSCYQLEAVDTILKSGISQLAIVSEANLGEASKVILKIQNIEIDVSAHGVAVPSLQVSDSVVVFLENNQAIIIQKLRSKGQRPQQGFVENKDGSLSLSAAQSVVIKTKKANFEISADGKIKIEGEEIFSVSKGLQHILGTQLNLN